jgi:hypothetical protein
VRRALAQIQLPLLNFQVFQHKDLFLKNKFGKTKNSKIKNNIISAEVEKVLQ